MGQHYRTLLSIGIPIMIGQMGMIVLSFADTMMVGHHSTTELGAASFVNNIMNLAIITGTGFSYGLTPIVGALFGRGEHAGAGQALRCSLLTNTLAAVAMMAVLLVLFFNLGNIGQPAELLGYMRPYYMVLFASLPFVMLFNAFKQFTDSITLTRTSMWILLTGNLLNIVGNYIFIYGKCGAPEMGVVGAGVSTLLSRIIMVVIFAAVFLRARRFASYREGFFRLGWSRDLLRRLGSLGTPIALEMGMETASFSLSIIMVGWLGTIALASHQVMSTISQFTFMVYYGLGAAVAVRTSYFHGQHDVQNVRHTVTAGLRLMVMLEVVLGGIIFRDFDGIVYGMMIDLIFAVIADKIMYGANAGKLALIVTNHGEAVTERIDELCGRGTTIIDARGGFRKDHRDVVLCACSGKEMFTITREVKLLDPASFTVILESNEVHGEGFRMLRVAEPHAGDEK